MSVRFRERCAASLLGVLLVLVLTGSLQAKRPDTPWTVERLREVCRSMGVASGTALQLYETCAPEFDSPEFPNTPEVICGLIEEAREEIVFELYALSPDASPRFQTALLDAAARGVRVVMALGDGEGIDEDFARLLGAVEGIDVHWIHLHSGGQVHSKTMVVDASIVTFGGANFSYPGWNENRELSFAVALPELARAVRGQIMQDLQLAKDPEAHRRPDYQQAFSYGPSDEVWLAESCPSKIDDPTIPNIEDFLEALIDSARERILLEQDYLHGKGGTGAALRRALERGVEVRVITDKKSYRGNHGVMRVFLEEMGTLGLKAKIFDPAPYGRESNKGKMHSKCMVVDGRSVFLGSNNWSPNGFGNHRELAVVFRNPRRAAELEAVFRRDWDDAHASWVVGGPE